MLHATLRRNVDSIRKWGVLARKSKGVAATVWLAAEGMITQSFAHAARRHSVIIEEVIVLRLSVPRSWLRRGKRKGVWHTGGRDIPPARVTQVAFVIGYDYLK